jgi:sortase A
MGPLRRGVRETGLALITLGVILLLFVLYQLVGTNITEHHNQVVAKKQFLVKQSQVVHLPNPANALLPPSPPGGAIDVMRIPKLSNGNLYVVEGTSEDDLRKGPGHYSGSPLPGETGNAAIAGHRTTYGAPFFELNRLAPGDPIYITDLANRTFKYVVSQPPQVVSPDDTSVLVNTPFAQLTLTTCNPRYSATSRLVVTARLAGRALPAPPITHVSVKTVQGVDTSSPTASSSTLGGGDNGAWPAAIAYGALVVLLWIGVRIWINRTRRWHRLAAYVIGIGICLVPLWFLFENAVLLLPQSI